MGDVAGDSAAGVSAAREAALRRRISREIWRALANPDYASALLEDPVRILDDTGWTLRQRYDLASIHATTIQQFARQAERVFWTGDSRERHASERFPCAVGQ